MKKKTPRTTGRSSITAVSVAALPLVIGGGIGTSPIQLPAVDGIKPLTEILEILETIPLRP